MLATGKKPSHVLVAILILFTLIGLSAISGQTAFAQDSSCQGTNACFQNSGSVGTNSCNGDHACMQQSHSIGNDSCNGSYACFQQNAPLDPENPIPCELTGTCPSVGNNSCNGNQACLQNFGSVGNNSCNGDGACIQQTGVGDCQFNLVPVPACAPEPEELINNLIVTISGFSLPTGTANSLIATLNAAIDALQVNDTTTACNNLNAFIHQVNAQSGRRLTTDQANQLEASADQIKASIGC